MKKAIVLTILSGVIAIACSNETTREVSRIHGKRIVMPTALHYYHGNLLEYNTADDALATLLIWYDSTQCSGCRLNNLRDLEMFERYCRDTLGPVNVDIIFSPPTDSHEVFEEMVEQARVCYPIYVDYYGLFAAQNKYLPKSEQLHTFLLDAESNVVLVGDPTQSITMWNLYKKYMAMLCDNNGILPSAN